jgi:O-antigen/teichoic acid export membrane protein
MLLGAATNIVHPVFFMTFASLGQTAQRHDAESSRQLLKLIGTNIALTITFSFLIIAVCAGFSSSILITVLGPGWASFHVLFSVLAVGAGVSLVRSCLGFILTGLNAFSPQTTITVVSAVLFVALAVLFGGREDVVGIALAWTCASSVAVCANTVVLGAVLRRHRLMPQVTPMTAAAHIGGER